MTFNRHNSIMLLPRLYPILSTDALEQAGLHFEHTAEAMLEAGVRIIQLRHKGHWGHRLFDQAKWLNQLCLAAGIEFVINDRADIARMLGAALHIGQDDLLPADARKVLGPDLILGYSTHNEAQMTRAQSEPIDYLVLGPIFGTASKANPDPVVGLSELARLRPLTPKPLVAIGGITLDNAPSVIAAGADSVAIISGLLSDPKQIRHTTEQWLKTLNSLPPRS